MREHSYDIVGIRYPIFILFFEDSTYSLPKKYPLGRTWLPKHTESGPCESEEDIFNSLCCNRGPCYWGR